MKHKRKVYKKLNLSGLIWLIVALLAFYVIVPQLKAFHSSWHLLAHPNLWWLTLALGLSFLTYLAAAATYCFLATKPLGLKEETIIQFAAMFVNRLLPAGIGGIGANFEYLKHKGYKSSQAASVVTTNNLLGLLGHLIVVVVALSLSTTTVIPTSSLKHGLINVTKITLLIGVVLVIVTIFISHRRVSRAIKEFVDQLITYEHRPYKTLLALLSQISLTLCNVLCLLYSAYAVGLHPSFLAVLIIFTFGSGVRNITPTPGGLGGFEAGLVAGLVAYHIASGPALAAVLLFRLASYWLPLILGVLAFIVAQRKRLFEN